MIKIDKHINDLLYEYDCVIVPEFGGFVSNYAAAKIHPTNHTFIPPSKNISFNKNLKNNDGLLANHIAITEKTSYSNAVKYLQLFTLNTNTKLKKGVKVTIEEVGTLYLDLERKIQFNPESTNHLLDSFGLTNFQSPAIKRDGIGKRIDKEFKDRKALPSEKKNINVKRYLAYAAVIPLIAAIVCVSLKTDVLKNYNYSGLNPFASIDSNYENSNKSNLEKPETNISKELVNINAGIQISSDTLKILSVIPAENKIDPSGTSSLEIQNNGVILADTTNVVLAEINISSELKFHIITGCFQILDNANKFIIDLNNKNIEASIIEKRNGLYVVSAGNYATRKEAYKYLSQLRLTQPEAWLLAKI